MTPNLNDPKAVAELGERIYRERYKDECERTHFGWFAAIDVASGKVYLAQRSEDALERARADAPDGIFHLVQVGYPGAFRVSHTRRHALSLDRLFR